MIRFSVVIPLYNKEKSIRKTINSVLAQSVEDFELIVVNDGSTDNSLGVVCQIKDPRIRVVNKINGGVSSARNRGIAEAKNEWIALLDGDDLWTPNHLENLAVAIRGFPQNKVFYTGYTTDRQQDFKPFSEEFAFEVKDYFKIALAGNGMCSSCVCFHSSIPKRISMFREDLTHGEDLDLWRRIVQHYCVTAIPKVTAIYRMGSENRAVRKVADPKKTIVWELDLSSLSDESEREYFRQIYYGFLYSYLPMNISFFLQMCLKKRFWRFGGFPKYVFMFNWNRLIRRFYRNPIISN